MRSPSSSFASSPSFIKLLTEKLVSDSVPPDKLTFVCAKNGIFWISPFAFAFAKLNPASTNTTDLGTTSLRWRNLYTQDLQLSNESSGGNDVDGTWGDWTLQEGETDIFMLNNRPGKKFKINMTEVD